jgi:hypothetical protein
MTRPRNHGPDYTRSFEWTLLDLARKKTPPLVPFLPDGVTARRDLMQPGDLHPTVMGDARVPPHGFMEQLEYLEGKVRGSSGRSSGTCPL